MVGEHTPTIIQLILSTNFAIIQLKDSHLFFIFPNRQVIQWCLVASSWENSNDYKNLTGMRVSSLTVSLAMWLAIRRNKSDK